jgi:hypothetical protein
VKTYSKYVVREQHFRFKIKDQVRPQWQPKQRQLGSAALACSSSQIREVKPAYIESFIRLSDIQIKVALPGSH